MRPSRLATLMRYVTTWSSLRTSACRVLAVTSLTVLRPAGGSGPLSTWTAEGSPRSSSWADVS